MEETNVKELQVVEKKYTVTEVCEMLDVKSHQIRYWESELELQFARDNRNRRFFTVEDIELLKSIKAWVEVDKHSLTTIKTFLAKKGIAITVTENALQNTDIKNFTPMQLQEVLGNVLQEIVLDREEKLIERFEKKLEEQEERHQRELKDLPELVRKQVESENQKLSILISELRKNEEKDLNEDKKWYQFWK